MTMTLLKSDRGADAGDLPLAVQLAVRLLPRVDLLPPEIGARRRLRRVQTGLAGTVLATLGVACLMWLSASASVSDAQAALDAETAVGAGLRAEQAAFAPVVETRRRAEVAERVLGEAMGPEVRFSGLLDTLARSTPDGVWISDLTLTQTAATAASPASAGTTPGPADAAVAAPIGTASITAVGFDHDSVAGWLESLAGATGFSDPAFSTSTASLRGERKVVEFASSATLTDAALSRRYTPQGG